MTQSPFTAAAVAAAASPLLEIRCHQGLIYWVTRRPSEGGRQVVMQYNPHNQHSRCLTPDKFSAQSRVHEYGGGCYALGADSLFFVNAADQRIYQQALTSQQVVAITPIGSRYGDIVVANNGNFLVAVREQHRDMGIINDLVRIDLSTQALTVLASGADFYASPALNNRDTQLVFLSWSHPDMPWNKTTLWQLDLTIQMATAIIDADEAVYQPGFTPDDQLFYVSDRSGWWNLYKEHTHLHSSKNDCGYPMWVLGTNQAIFTDQQAWFISGEPGKQLISNDTGEVLNLPFSDFQPTLAYNRTTHSLYFVAGCYNQPDALYDYNLITHELKCLAKSAEHTIAPGHFTRPKPIQFEQDGQTVYGFYYPAKPISDQLPPLIVNAHGGPNGSATTQCQFKIQFWTSRGFAYLDVNYRGSTGYGRAYREALDGQWGVADVEDCYRLTRYCINQGFCDPARVFIRGQSAGGLTALAACIFHSLFAAGVSCYGVSDLTTLIHDTHKFECHYLDKLIGPYPQAHERYLARSPAYHLDRLTVPLLFLQGLEDQVVPAKQTKAMTNKLDANNQPYTYVEFSNEGHGFTRSENMIQAIEAELAFYESIQGALGASNASV